MKSLFFSRSRLPASPGRSAVRKGVTVVEFAMVAPLLFTMIFSIIEFSRILMVQNAVTDGAREAAREASLASSRSASTVESNLRNRLSSSVPTGSEMSVTVTPSNLALARSGDEVRVQVSLNYGDVSWVPASLFNISANSQLRGESRMERE